MHWRETELIDILKKKGKCTTSDIVSNAHMSKVTALKYLEILKQKNLVDNDVIGPTKVWFLKTEKEKIENKIKVLAVDDDENVITIIRETLEPETFEFFEAANGKEALGMAFSKSPDILVLDIMMPDMDGYSVCKELKKHENTRNTPIIILTAKTGIDDKLKAMDLGINDYIVKPFDSRELKARIKMVLNWPSIASRVN